MTDKEQPLYRVVCPDLNNVLLIKGLGLEEERELYTSIRRRVHEATEEVNIPDYKVFISNTFCSQEAIVTAMEDNDILEDDEVYDAIYEAIIGMYPNFALSFICTDLNSATFIRGLDEKDTIAHLKKTLGGLLDDCDEDIDITLSSLEDILDVENLLKKNIIGQRGAIDSVVKALKLAATGLSQGTSFLFVGPTGVGKTELARHIGARYSGNFYKINCAEYAGGHEYAKLIGSPPGYIGHTEKSLMAEKAEKSNRWVFLFDEIEKAHHKLYDFLLSLLDDGTCTDNLGQVLDFRDSIFIFTSNKGIVEAKQRRMGFTENDPSEQEQADSVRASVKGHFSPEFLNRIDEVVTFEHLSKKDVRKIARLQLEDLPITITDPLVEFVVKGGYSREYGARNIARFIKNKVSPAIADAILHERVPKGILYTPRVTKEGVKIISTRKYAEGKL
jgi:MoxR-like ATPase